MTKQSIFGRIAQLAKANINAISNNIQINALRRSRSRHRMARHRLRRHMDMERHRRRQCNIPTYIISHRSISISITLRAGR